MNKGKENILHKISIGLFIAYMCYLLYLTLLSPYYGRSLQHRSINIIPFRTITQYIFSESIKAKVTNILGNIAAFFPLGLLLPVINARLRRIGCVIPIILLTTAFIELMQLVLRVGASDIDDIILNLLGGITGFLLYKIFWNNRII